MAQCDEQESVEDAEDDESGPGHAVERRRSVLELASVLRYPRREQEREAGASEHRSEVESERSSDVGHVVG